MLPKVSTNVKSFDGQAKWRYFLIEDDDFQKNIILFGIKSVLISKMNLIVSLSTTKNSENQNKILC